jgi:Mg-chelatase subunit ChlD
MKNIFCICFGVVVFLSVSSGIFAQDSASSASVSRSRALANSANPGSYRSNSTFVAPDEVAVEEFVNYHRHQLPLPKSGQSVAVDVRWGNDKVSTFQKDAVLQIGFATAFADERTDLRPLNLSLVIDKSGSMAAEDKMSRVKESLRTMIGQLRENDIVSIIVFDTEARVLCSAARVGNGNNLKRAIDSIYPDGSTNLHGGLMLGYKEAQKNYEKDSTNRVILLTDGIANVGTTDPKTISVESSEFNGQGIDLSTIGVGIDLDRELLRTLSKQGRGLFHFVADAYDIEKVFVKEVQSLISPVARRVNLEVDFDSNLELEKVFGYAPQFQGNRLTIPIDDMNNGLTQVVMMNFRLKNAGNLEKSFLVRVKLSYFDIKTRKQIVENQNAILTLTQEKNVDLLADSLVKKNYTIAELAQSLFEMKETVGRGNYREAERVLDSSVAQTFGRYPNMQDTDIKFILDIVQDYQRNLKNYNRGQNGSDCGKCD